MMLFLFLIPIIIGFSLVLFGITVATITQAHRTAAITAFLGLALVALGCIHGLVTYLASIIGAHP